MNGIWYYLYAFITVWILAFVFKKKLEKYNFKIEFPMIMWKTKMFKGFIDKVSNLSPKFWKLFFNIGVIVSFIAMIIISYMLIHSLSSILETQFVSIVLPGVEVPESPIYVPFTYGFLAIITVLIVHEFAHGIAARVDKISIKFIGLLLVTVLPGAFVELDENKLKHSSKLSRLRVYCAGSIANMSFAAVAIICTILISSFLVPAAFYNDGMEITRVMENSPANEVLHEGIVIESFNNQTFNDIEEYNQIISNFKPHENITIGTNEGSHVVQLDMNPNNNSRGYIGVIASPHYMIQDDVSNVFGDQLPWIWFILLEFFNWIFVLNIGIGLFNLLPIKPLDGGHMFEILLSYRLSKEYYKPIVKIVSIFLAMIIILNLISGFI